MEKMWEFKTRNFAVQWLIQDDVLDTAYMDKKLAAECRENVESGEWRCFESTFRVIHNATGAVLAETYLGNSIYENPADFRDHFGMNRKGHGSYFSDLVREAIREARKKFPELQASLMAVKLRNLAEDLAAA